uniref:Zinc finger, CCHC-type n=1 Tax=Heterorhabditis bacteriophora TaxID=37862 RepID=A0A1I7XN09_HETBA
MRVYEDQNLEIVGEKQQENTDQCQRDFWGDLARPTREYVDSIDDNTIRIELATYSSILRKNPVHIDSNPLEFWSKSQLVLPKLLLVDHNDQTADDAYSDEYESDISEEL